MPRTAVIPIAISTIPSMINMFLALSESREISRLPAPIAKRNAARIEVKAYDVCPTKKLSARVQITSYEMEANPDIANAIRTARSRAGEYTVSAELLTFSLEDS